MAAGRLREEPEVNFWRLAPAEIVPGVDIDEGLMEEVWQRVRDNFELISNKQTRAQAASQGRTYATPDDVKALGRVVIPHRLLVTPEVRMRGVTPTDVVNKILDGVPIPRPEQG